MASEPTVSVIIPSYNHERFVEAAVRSVLGQTFQDFEIVVVDDGSSDGTPDVVKKIKDPRISLHVFDKNRGACAAANECIARSRGRFVAMLSSDDMFLPHRLEMQVLFLEKNPGFGAVFGLASLVDESGAPFVNERHHYTSIFKQPNRPRAQWLNRFFHQGNCLCHPSMLIRRECYDSVGNYDNRLAQLPDFDFYVRLCMKHEIHIIQEPLINFRIMNNEANVSGFRPTVLVRSAFEQARVLRHFLKITNPDELLAVFPELEPERNRVTPETAGFHVAMLAAKKDSPEHKLFAMNTLFDLLGDEQTAKAIEDVCGFRHTDFIRLTGSLDVFDTLERSKRPPLHKRLMKEASKLRRK